MKWNKCEDVLPPLYEEVLILYKDKADELKQDNLYYGLSKRYKDTTFDCERWSCYTEYQRYYEPVYWMHLPEMPVVEHADWYDTPVEEMTLEQARQAVKDLREVCLKAYLGSENK